MSGTPWPLGVGSQVDRCADRPLVYFLERVMVLVAVLDGRRAPHLIYKLYDNVVCNCQSSWTPPTADEGLGRQTSEEWIDLNLGVVMLHIHCGSKVQQFCGTYTRSQRCTYRVQNPMPSTPPYGILCIHWGFSCQCRHVCHPCTPSVGQRVLVWSAFKSSVWALGVPSYATTLGSDQVLLAQIRC